LQSYFTGEVFGYSGITHRSASPRPKPELGQANASNNSCKAALTGAGFAQTRCQSKVEWFTSAVVVTALLASA
jgi:hypothetical protein